MAIDFHKPIFTFAELPNGKIVATQNDPRPHSKWLEEDYKINARDFRFLVHGYIAHKKIVFYKGQNPVPMKRTQRTSEIRNILFELLGLSTRANTLLPK